MVKEFLHSLTSIYKYFSENFWQLNAYSSFIILAGFPPTTTLSGTSLTTTAPAATDAAEPAGN